MKRKSVDFDFSHVRDNLNPAETTLEAEFFITPSVSFLDKTNY